MLDHTIIEYDALQRLGITDPKGFIKKRYKGEPIVYLSTCCAGRGIQEQIEASVEEALSNSSWVDILVSINEIYFKFTVNSVCSDMSKQHFFF